MFPRLKISNRTGVLQEPTCLRVFNVKLRAAAKLVARLDRNLGGKGVRISPCFVWRKYRSEELEITLPLRL